MNHYTPIEQSILAQLEERAAEHQRSAIRAAERGNLADAAYWQRWAVAFCNAADDFEDGTRAEQMSSGAYLVPSSSSPNRYAVLRGACPCHAGRHGDPCRHAALAVAYELAYDDLVSFDPPGEPSPLGDEPGDTPPSDWRAATLGRRLCAVRSRYVYA